MCFPTVWMPSRSASHAHSAGLSREKVFPSIVSWDTPESFQLSSMCIHDTAACDAPELSMGASLVGSMGDRSDPSAFARYSKALTLPSLDMGSKPGPAEG